MTLTTLAWLAMAAYALHIMEEYTFDWRNWALLMAYPIVMLNLRSKPYFIQD
jgi:hypothetical protein